MLHISALLVINRLHKTQSAIFILFGLILASNGANYSELIASFERVFIYFYCKKMHSPFWVHTARKCHVWAG